MPELKDYSMIDEKVVSELQTRADTLNENIPKWDTRRLVTIEQVALTDIESAEDTVVTIIQEKEQFNGATHLTKKIVSSASLGREVMTERIYDLDNPIRNNKDEIVAYRVTETRLTLTK